MAPQIPTSLIEATGDRDWAPPCLLPCFGRRNGAHRTVERWAEHRSCMAAAQWIDTTTNRTIVSARCSALERRCERAERVGEEVYSSFRVANRAMKKMEIERVIGPQISMASAGWEDATTNQKATVLWDIGEVRWCTGR